MTEISYVRGMEKNGLSSGALRARARGLVGPRAHYQASHAPIRRMTPKVLICAKIFGVPRLQPYIGPPKGVPRQLLRRPR